MHYGAVMQHYYDGGCAQRCLSIYHRSSAALRADPEFKVDSMGTHHLRGSWLSCFQCEIKVPCSRSDPHACKSSTALLCHQESGLLGIAEACPAHNCKGWISLANEPTTLSSSHSSKSALRAGCV